MTHPILKSLLVAASVCIGTAPAHPLLSQEVGETLPSVEGPAPADAGLTKQHLILVVGAAGSDEFVEPFQTWARRWEEAAERGQVQLTRIEQPTPSGDSPRQQLQTALTTAREVPGDHLWLVLIGHGTFDGKIAKFNLTGPDVSAAEIAAWIADCQRPIAIVNSASASAPFIRQLSGDNRVVVTATKSGYEINFARLGDYLSQAIGDPAADLDKDGQTSLLEAFIAASKDVAAFYEQEARLATEHPLIDDNGDQAGTPGDWFRGVRAARQAKDDRPVDGRRANQFHLVRRPEELVMSPADRLLRSQLESQVEQLRGQKQSLDEDVYYQQLHAVMTRLAHLYQRLDDPPAPAPAKQ